MKEINSAGYLSPEAVFVDGTHIKANANMKKVVKKAVPEAARIYEEQLRKEIINNYILFIFLLTNGNKILTFDKEVKW